MTENSPRFVSALLFILLCDLNRIACVLQIDKIHSLHDSASVNVQARNDTLCQHVAGSLWSGRCVSPRLR